jgi:hypothetical protein
VQAETTRTKLRRSCGISWHRSVNAAAPCAAIAGAIVNLLPSSGRTTVLRLIEIEFSPARGLNRGRDTRTKAFPRKQRSDIGAAVPAGPTGELRLEIGQPNIIRPLAGVDRDRMGAAIVLAIDQRRRGPDSRISP